MEYVETVLGVASFLVAPVYKYLRYHRKHNDYVRNFKRTRDELNCNKADIELQLEAELLPVGKKPKRGIESWLENAKAMITEAQDVETKVSNGRYLWRGYNGMLVDEKTTEMLTLLNNAPNVSESLVIDCPSVGLPLPTSEIVGEKDARDEIWTSLMQEEVSKIGVWGMGGVGKTTIMKYIHNELLKERRFERVIWVTISKEFNILKVQDDIASELKIQLPEEGDQLTRAKQLLDIMKRAGKHVLILDDVWDKVSLEEVGIPEPSSRNGCKLVLTTRSEPVCKYMGCKVIKVEPLSKDEALRLFLNNVGPNMEHNQTLMPYLRLVVKECAGLPLTIVVIAGTLKGEDDPLIWKKMLKELKDRIGKVEGAEEEVIEILKFSFDHLKVEKVKQCFLYCALYPEDFLMPKDELVECWIDEGFIEEMDTRQEMIDEGHVVLKRLVDNCLLQNSKAGYQSQRLVDNCLLQNSKAGFQSQRLVHNFLLQNSTHSLHGPCVKMHDAVRDMALSITSMNPRYMIQAGLQLTELPEVEKLMPDVRKISLMYNSISKIPADMPPPKCQLLTSLLLQQNPGLKKIPNSFFANMPCLRVLNLSRTAVDCLPDSISELKNLVALLLGDCSNLRHVPCLAKLQGLKKLDLNETRIEEVPEGMDQLINLRYLDLSIKTLRGIPVGLLTKLSRLQYLRFSVDNEKTTLKAEDIIPLKKLELFCGRFEDVDELNKFVSSMQQGKKNLIKYQLHVGSYNWIPKRDKGVSIKEFELDGRELMLPNDIQELKITKCHLCLGSLSNYISSFKNAIDLRDCSIWDCEGIECVVSLSSFSSSCTPPFQSLETLYLQNLPELSGITNDEGFGSAARTSILAPSATFSHLKHIIVYDCKSMEMLLPHWLLPNLENLEEIKVYYCKQLVEILRAAPTSEQGSDMALIKFNLPKLKMVRMSGLPELKRICSKSGVMVCDSLQLIEVNYCDKLKRIPPFVPLVGNGQPYEYVPPSLEIKSGTRKWWESLEWGDHPNFKNLLEPLWNRC